MPSFKLAYKIEEGPSWKGPDAITIKSNLADDELVDCQLAKSLVETLKKESAVLEPDKLILAIAEAQKRQIVTSLEQMDDMAIHAKVHADKAHQILLDSATEAEEKYDELEKTFSATEKRFNTKLTNTAESIKADAEKLSIVEERLSKINNYSLDKLIETLSKLIQLAESDAELVKLVLDHKSKVV